MSEDRATCVPKAAFEAIAAAGAGSQIVHNSTPAVQVGEAILTAC